MLHGRTIRAYSAVTTQKTGGAVVDGLCQELDGEAAEST